MKFVLKLLGGILGCLLVLYGVVVTYDQNLVAFLAPVKKVQIIAPLYLAQEKEVQELLIAANIQKASFFNINMTKIKKELKKNDWIDNINIVRVWPDQIRIKFDEKEPLAYWGDEGIITRQDCKMVPKNSNISYLPILLGDKKNSEKLCDILEKMKISIKPIGVEIKKLFMSQRGSWYLELTNGLLVFLGNKDIIERTDKFVSFFIEFKKTENFKNYFAVENKNVYPYIDMRYKNGLAIGADIKNKLIELVEIA